VATVPLSSFYHEPPDPGLPFVRVTFAKRPETIAEALERLGAAVAAQRGG
jgi:aspartate/methionine/tyrosine aminotransferase